MAPSVSIVIPARNEADNIGPLLHDLLAQTSPPAEVIVVDTGSQDETRERVREQAAVDDRVRLIALADGYPGAGRNAGLLAARADWVAFIDAGMRVDARWLEHLMRPLALSAELDAILGGLEPTVESRAQRAAALAYVPARRSIPGGEGMWRGFCLPSSAVRRRLALELGGFPESLRSGEDLWFHRRLSKRARIGYAPDAVVRWSHASTPNAVWRRFRTYAEHSFRGGLMEDWFDVIARRYLLALVATGPAWPATVAAMLLARAAVMQHRKSEFTDRNPAARIRQLFEVGFYLGLIDAATLVAWWRWRRSGSELVELANPPSITVDRTADASH